MAQESQSDARGQDRGGTSNRGFASMDEDKQRDIARKGGESVPDDKRSFSQDRELAAEAGRKGGEARGGSEGDRGDGGGRGFAGMDEEQQREISRKGGEASHGGR
jgi:general stress protein YciG